VRMSVFASCPHPLLPFLFLFFLPILVDDKSKGGRGSMYNACRFGNGQEVGYVFLMMGDETQGQRRQSGLS
jgi:hypothetical protein